MDVPLNQVISPTDEQRHEMLKNTLQSAGRIDDYDYIIKYLSPPPDITSYAAPGSMKGVKIGVIGGGLAGMTAAFELRKLGADITILEASKDRIGGRVYTYYFNDKYYGELGAARFPVSHETTWYYINLFQLTTVPMNTDIRSNFIYVHNTRLRRSDSVQEILYPFYELTPQERATPWSELSSYALDSVFYQLSPEVRSEMIRILPSYSPEYLPLINKSVRETLENLNLSQGAINLISGISPGTGAYLDVSDDAIANETYTFDYRNIFRIEGGNINLSNAFYQSFQISYPTQYHDISQDLLGSVTYKTGHSVTGIYQSPYQNKIILKYNDEFDTGNPYDKADVFDYVICTIPFSCLRPIEIRPYFRNVTMQAILEWNYSDSLKSLALCNRRFWEENTDYGKMFGGLSVTDRIIQQILYPTDHILCHLDNTCPPEEPGVLIATYNYSQSSTRLGNLERLRQFNVIKRNIEAVHGLPIGFLDSIIEQEMTLTWNNQPNALGAFIMDLPQQKELFAYAMQQPEYNNRLYFAGEHISMKHGWVQGALYTGKDAANKLAQQFTKGS